MNSSIFKTCQTEVNYFVSVRATDGRSLFESSALCTQMLDLMKFYRSKRYVEGRRIYESYHVKILSYCIMPDRYILVLKQTTDQGIHYFMHHIHEAIVSYYKALFKISDTIHFLPIVTEILNTDELFSAIQYTNTSFAYYDMVHDGSMKRHYPWSSSNELMNLGHASVVHVQELTLVFKGRRACRDFIQKTQV